MSATKELERVSLLLSLALDREQLKRGVAKHLREYTGRDLPLARITQEEMTRRLVARRYPDGDGSLTIRNYQRWESGEVTPRIEWFPYIADELGIPLSALLDGDAPRPATVADLRERWDALVLEGEALLQDLSVRGRDGDAE